ncbi:MAG: hypothetical protein WBD22_09215 [Pyrinomonadaceae bacterium]
MGEAEGGRFWVTADMADQLKSGERFESNRDSVGAAELKQKGEFLLDVYGDKRVYCESCSYTRKWRVGRSK